MNIRYITVITIILTLLIGCGKKEDDTVIKSISTNNKIESSVSYNVNNVQKITPTLKPVPTPVSKNNISKNEICITLTPTSIPTITPTPTIAPTPIPEIRLSDNVKYDIIIDTDYASDSDDVAALKVGIMLDKLGETKLKAVVTSAEGDYVCRAAHGQLSYEGYNTLPVGMARRGVEDWGPYWDIFVSKLNDQATYQLIDGVELYRNILREANINNTKIRIIVLGFMVNIQDILMDEECYSLIESNVDSIWIDGGAYPMTGKDFNFYWTPECIESIQYAIANSPVPLVFITNETGCNYETGVCVTCGSNLKQLDPDITEPVNIAYRAFEDEYGANLDGGHMAWDAITVWSAVKTRDESMTKLTPIDAYVYEDGTNEFIINPNGKHYILERENYNVNWYSQQLDSLIKINMQ